MTAWGILLIFLVGVAFGVGGMIYGPELVDPYLPGVMRVDMVDIEGKVVSKQKEGDRLLLTVLAPQGSILATFEEKVTEIDLLVTKGDMLTLTLKKYSPFVEDPVIGRVRKQEPTRQEEGGKPWLTPR